MANRRPRPPGPPRTDSALRAPAGRRHVRPRTRPLRRRPHRQRPRKSTSCRTPLNRDGVHQAVTPHMGHVHHIASLGVHGVPEPDLRPIGILVRRLSDGSHLPPATRRNLRPDHPVIPPLKRERDGSTNIAGVLDNNSPAVLATRKNENHRHNGNGSPTGFHSRHCFWHIPHWPPPQVHLMRNTSPRPRAPMTSPLAARNRGAGVRRRASRHSQRVPLASPNHAQERDIRGIPAGRSTHP